MKIKIFLFGLVTVLIGFGVKGLEPLPAYANGNYTITYELFGGTNDAANPSTYNLSSNIVLEDATKNGLSFGGWYSSFNYEPNTLVTNLPDDLSGNLTLYARWAPLSYTVNFEENGGEEVAAGEVPASYIFYDNSYEYRYSSPVVSSVYKILSADLNLDGYGDFIQASNGTKEFVTYISNGASGGFTATAVASLYQPNSGFLWDMEFSDLDLDGFKDLVFSYEQYSGGASITWKKGTGIGTFDAEAVLPIASGGMGWGAVISTDVGDINRDQLPDIVLVNGGDFAYLLNQGNGTFGPLTQLNQTAVSGGSYGRYAYLVDLNGDGNLDFIGHKEETAHVYISDGSTIFTGTPLSFLAQSYNGFASDNDRDGIKEYYAKAGNWSGVLKFTFNESFTSATASYNLVSPQGGFFGNFFSFDFKDVNFDGFIDPLYMAANGITFFLMSNDDGSYSWQKQFVGNYHTAAIVHNRVDGSYYFVGHEISTGYTNVYGLANARYTTPLYGTTTTRDGYTFDGWYLDNDEWTSPFNFYGNTISQDVTVYAKWNVNQYAVTYYLNGGTNNNSNPTTLNINSPTYTLSNPTKEHAIFLGWYDNSDFEGDPVTSIPSGTTEALSLYAKWNNALTVTYNTNGGSSVAKSYVFSGETIPTPNDPTRVGYTFGGWYANAGLTQTFTFGAMPSNNITVYAKWIVQQFTLSFDTNGGNDIPEVSLDYNAPLLLPTEPTRQGYFFLGWYTDESLTAPLSLSKMPANNLVLYAKWVLMVFTLQYEIDGRLTSAFVGYGTALSSVLPSPSKYQHEFVGWALNGVTIDLATYTMPDAHITLVAIFRDNVTPVVYTVSDGETYSTAVELIFDEGTATLNDQTITSGTTVTAPGAYELIVTDSAGNQRVVHFTIVEPGNNRLLLYGVYAFVFVGVMGFIGYMTLNHALPDLPTGKKKE